MGRAWAPVGIVWWRSGGEGVSLDGRVSSLSLTACNRHLTTSHLVWNFISRRCDRSSSDTHTSSRARRLTAARCRLVQGREVRKTEGSGGGGGRGEGEGRGARPANVNVARQRGNCLIHLFNFVGQSGACHCRHVSAPDQDWCVSSRTCRLHKCMEITRVQVRCARLQCGLL